MLLLHISRPPFAKLRQIVEGGRCGNMEACLSTPPRADNTSETLLFARFRTSLKNACELALDPWKLGYAPSHRPS